MQLQSVETTRRANKTRTAGQLAGISLRGFAMGVCEVIPGVSGGTMAFILGIYEELIDSIKTVGEPDFLQAVFRLRIKEIFQILNWKFLVALLVGMLVAIFSLASLIDWLLKNQPVLIWSFFFGLVLASVFLVSRRIKRWTPALVVIGIVAAVATYFLVGLAPAQTPDTWWFLLLSGAVAICAMILPGISGSYVLVILQKYEQVVGAAKAFDVGVLFWVALGAVIGLVTFAQLVSWLFKRYHDIVVAALTGLMLGSLRQIWPWKSTLEFIETHGSAAVNRLPSPATDGLSEILLAVLLLVVGMVSIILIERLGGGSTEQPA